MSAALARGEEVPPLQPELMAAAVSGTRPATAIAGADRRAAGEVEPIDMPSIGPRPDRVATTCAVARVAFVLIAIVTPLLAKHEGRRLLGG